MMLIIKPPPQTRRSADALYTNALPVVSTPEIWDLLTANRGILSDKRTGASVSDAQILGSDITRPKFFVVKVNADVDRQVISLLEKLARSRRALVSTMRQSLNSDFLLDTNQELKDYLFEQGSVQSVLERHQLLEDSSGALPRASACLLARYDHRLSGMLADLLVTGVGASLGTLAYLKAQNLFSELSRMTLLARSASLGMMLASAKPVLHDIYRNCFSAVGRPQRTRNSLEDAELIALLHPQLPDDIPYDRFGIKFDPQQTPACHGSDPLGGVTLNATFDANCIGSVWRSFAPLQISLPMMAAESAVH